MKASCLQGARNETTGEFAVSYPSVNLTVPSTSCACSIRQLSLEWRQFFETDKNRKSQPKGGTIRMNRELLEKPFSPDQIKQREGVFGDVLDYVEASTVIHRLNEAFEAEWMFEILDHHVYEKEVVVLGKLTAQGISKCQFGKSKITLTKDEK